MVQVAGHIQIYSSKSKDDLAIFGNMGGDPELEPLDDYVKVKSRLSSLANVKTVPAASAAPATAVTVVRLLVMRVLLIVEPPSTSSAVPLGPASAVEATSTSVRLSSTVLLRSMSELNPTMIPAS